MRVLSRASVAPYARRLIMYTPRCYLRFPVITSAACCRRGEGPRRTVHLCGRLRPVQYFAGCICRAATRCSFAGSARAAETHRVARSRALRARRSRACGDRRCRTQRHRAGRIVCWRMKRPSTCNAKPQAFRCRPFSTSRSNSDRGTARHRWNPPKSPPNHVA